MTPTVTRPATISLKILQRRLREDASPLALALDLPWQRMPMKMSLCARPMLLCIVRRTMGETWCVSEGERHPRPDAAGAPGRALIEGAQGTAITPANPIVRRPEQEGAFAARIIGHARRLASGPQTHDAQAGRAPGLDRGAPVCLGYQPSTSRNTLVQFPMLRFSSFGKWR